MAVSNPSRYLSVNMNNSNVGDEDTNSPVTKETSSIPYISGEFFNGPNNVYSDTLAVELKINEIVELCAASDKISGYTLIKKLGDRIKGILPDNFQGFKLFRSGFLFIGSESELDIAVEQWIKKLINLVEAPLSIQGQTINLTGNVGIARSTESVKTLEDLTDRAQYALRNSDGAAGSNYNIFDSDRAEQSRDEVTMTQELYRALDKDELTLYYQPVYSLEDLTIVGAEALIRWEHPSRGFVSPGEFIPLAEKTGQIIFIDRWVLEQAARQVVEWMDILGREVPLGVNISAWQFRDDFLVEKVERIIDEVGLPPELLKIEITETSVMNDTKHASEMINDLKDLGIKIALDDFGTGHSSFEYLSEFSIDELKIDRSFLDFDDVYNKNQTLVDVMIQTGQRTDLDILAEGIETEEQFEYLKNRGCGKAQGFLMDRPMPANEFTDKLKADSSICVP